MRFFMIGNAREGAVVDPPRRVELTYAKANELGIAVLNRCRTIGHYDFCSLIEAPSAEAAAAFTLWYRGQNFGDCELLTVLEDDGAGPSQTQSSGG